MTSPDLAAAIVESLDDESLDRLAALLAPRLAGRLAAEVDGVGWLTPAAAGRYLGVSTRRVYDLKSAAKLPADGADGRVPLWRRETLDEYARRTR